ncbi:MAG TPA: hypothetical protein VFF11_11840, partial [Candidatus Binatia bacterium]|nr:hypothetical protein [Candidatus Binatia bacterium]
YGSVIYNSTNSGLTWRTNPVPSATWHTVACSVDGTKLVAVPLNGRSYTSTNSGTTWTTNNLPNDSWQSVVSSADGTQLAVVSFNIYTSTNSGMTWNSNSAPRVSWGDIASSADGHKLAAIVKNGGIWTAQTTPAPTLNIKPAGDSFDVSWLVPSTNFVMQQSSDLLAWEDVTNMPVLNLTNLENEILVPSTNSSALYRLKTP